MLTTAVIVAVWAGFCALDQYGPQFGFRKAFLSGSIAGFLMGDLQQGLIIAGTLELMWLGVNNVGAYIPPDVISGAIVGVAAGIMTGKGVAAALAVALPIAIVVQQIDMLWQTAATYLLHKADDVAATGDFDAVQKWHLLGMVGIFLTRAIPVFFAIYFGVDWLSKAFSVIPKAVIDGIAVASGMLPAIGIAMLLNIMVDRETWIFVLVGLALVAYLKVPIMGVVLIGVFFAVLYDLIKNNKGSTNFPNESGTGGNIDL